MNDAVRSDSSPVLAVDAGQSSTRVRCEPGPWGPGWIVTSSGVRTALPLAQQFATIMHDVATAHPEITQSECTVAIGSSGARDDEDPIPVLHALKPFGVSRVLLAHDSITSYLGALGDQLGVVTASGTGVITLAVALPTALISALLASLWLSRRLRTPLQDLTRAATSLTAGNSRIRVPAGKAGPEVTTLAHAFNTMADRLEHTEQVRRQMLSDLAHEMGTPLSVLTVYLDGLQDGVVDWNNATHTIMADQLTRLTRLMEDIDDVSRAQEHRIDLDLAEEGLGNLLHTAAAAAGEAYADKGVDLQIETITHTARALVDRQRFGQVMSNLLSNALRHTPAGGQVRISVHRQGASTALIHVADDGEGIPPDQLRYIFERFYRGDAARSRDDGGAGIGLTISKALIEAHGGTLTATSPGPGRGAVFALRLPLSPSDSEEAAR